MNWVDLDRRDNIEPGLLKAQRQPASTRKEIDANRAIILLR